MSLNLSPGERFRQAVTDEKPLQVVGAINAFAARMAERVGFRALYLSGGGVAVNSLGLPDLGISTLDDVLTDVRRITDATNLPLLVDADTGWGGAFNIARTVRAMTKAGAAGIHLEDQVSEKRCGHRPGKEIVSREEMCDRIIAAVDARTDERFVIMARTDAVASEGLDAGIARAHAYVDAGADMIFAEAVADLESYAGSSCGRRADPGEHHRIRGDADLHERRARGRRRRHRLVLLFRVSCDERGGSQRLSDDPQHRNATRRDPVDADAERYVRFLDYYAYEQKLDELFKGTRPHDHQCEAQAIGRALGRYRREHRDQHRRAWR